jgi:NAD(P)-dependent dehydrogenase (short-subunit alcohol dehydrogenase family)
MKKRTPVANKVVAITGGARGIGRATALALLAGGAKVAIGDLDAAFTEQAAQELGVGCVGLGLDVTDRGLFSAFLDETEQRLGPLDVLINNAGIMAVDPFVEQPDEMSDLMINVNLRGVLLGSRLALERMLPRDHGHVVNIASVAGKAAFPRMATYCATKHAVLALSESIRSEIRSSGVEISCVAPSITSTELALGISTPPGFSQINPELVAAAIVGLLERPRFEVVVPTSVGHLLRVTSLLPRRVRDRLDVLLKTDDTRVDGDARAAYISRYEQGAELRER